MSDSQRGNTKHGPRLDEQMEQETRAMTQGHAGAPHAEPFRETEPLPDDTDSPEVERSFRNDLGGDGDLDTTGDPTHDPAGDLAGDAAADPADGTTEYTTESTDDGEDGTR